MRLRKCSYVLIMCSMVFLNSALAAPPKNPVKPKASPKTTQKSSGAGAGNRNVARPDAQPKPQPQSRGSVIARPKPRVKTEAQQARYSIALIRRDTRTAKTIQTLKTLKRANSLPQEEQKPKVQSPEIKNPIGAENLHQPAGTRAQLMKMRPLPTAVYAGNLPLHPEVQNYRKAFEGGMPATRVLKSDLKVYYYSNSEKPGENKKWFSTEVHASAENATQRLALPSKPRYLHSATIPAGTMIYEGNASRVPGKTGGGHQIFVKHEDLKGIAYDRDPAVLLQP